MAQHQGPLKPPPIVGAEVSAIWKSTWKGEVIMTVVMPPDVVDTEVYVKTLRRHSGIQMGPQISSTWRTWSFSHPPKKEQRKR